MNIKLKIKLIIILVVFIIVRASALEMTLQGRIDELYDDNINSSSINTQSDFITNIALGIVLSSDLRAQDFTLTCNDYQRYSMNNENNNVNYQDLAFTLGKIFQKIYLFIVLMNFNTIPNQGALTPYSGEVKQILDI